jgi:hypothetical protein
MKRYLFILAALAFAASASPASAVPCYWVGGTATWDGTNTGGGGAGGIKWASATGGSSACAGGGTGGSPTSGDTANFDANSGGGTVTVNTTVNVTSITAGAFTGTLDFATNNNNVTAQTVSFTGSATRTINMGSGTWTITGSSATPFDVSVTTGLTPSFSNASIVLSANSAARVFSGGGQTYGSFTVNANSTKGLVSVSGTNTFASVTVNGGNSLGFPQGVTTTISGALVMSGSSSAPVGLLSTGPATNPATVSVGSASTIDWGGILRVTKAGAGSITATNSLDMGGNTGISISAPSGGGGGSVCVGC